MNPAFADACRRASTPREKVSYLDSSSRDSDQEIVMAGNGYLLAFPVELTTLPAGKKAALLGSLSAYRRRREAGGEHLNDRSWPTAAVNGWKFARLNCSH